jgi:rhodanese-related sulfurtransferase
MAITDINAEELEQMLVAEPALQLVDVRTPEEFNYLGHIQQAKLIPLYELPFGFRTLSPAEKVVVTCQHGIRSIDACYFLQAQGFEQLYNFQEGMASWTGPVEKDLSMVEQLMNPGTQGE